MKLLLDENLSPQLIESLADQYPGSCHVDQVGLGGAEDAEVWDYAKAHGFAIISKDSDFAERSVLESDPPKIIWIRLGTAPRLTSKGCCDRSSRRCGGSWKKMKRHACC